jgi:hypothetical protein
MHAWSDVKYLEKYGGNCEFDAVHRISRALAGLEDHIEKRLLQRYSNRKFLLLTVVGHFVRQTKTQVVSSIRFNCRTFVIADRYRASHLI